MSGFDNDRELGPLRNGHSPAFHGKNGRQGDHGKTTTICYPCQEETAEFELQDVSPPPAVFASSEYEIVRELARGGMGIIYEAIDIRLDRQVAVKVLRPDHQKKRSLVQRFTEEARIMSALQHPGIAPIYQVGTCEDGRPFHVMKLVRGSTLATLLSIFHSDESDICETQRTSFSSLINIFADVCQALAYTHSRGILHLDLKPANVMVGAFGEVHLMDWGLSRPLEAYGGSLAKAGSTPLPKLEPASVRKRARLKGRHQIHGTPAYMSPEQARGTLCDRRSDVFGLGAILAEILTGSPPYWGKSSRQVFGRAFYGQINKISDALDQVDTDCSLVRLAQKCLSIKREHRPRNASEVASELAAYQQTRLQRVEHDFERFFDLSLDLFCIAGTDGYFRRINSNFSRVLGYTEKDLLSRPFLDFVQPEDRAETIRVMKVLQDGEPVVRFRNRYITASGNVVVFEWTAKSMAGENLVFAVARDVSESTGEGKPNL